jgi:hypothetical protein
MKTAPTHNRLNLKKYGTLLALGALTIASFTGCVADRPIRQSIAIESDPPGMRVEANGENLGNTPTSYMVKANSRGNFAGGWGDRPSIVFTAFPPEGSPGLYKQVKSFGPRAFGDAGDRVPERIFFDMHRSPGN